ncbi:MAG: FMN-binding protein, partial [Xanthomonadales bacterium]|nr:FMN-binding protein [Xanthomonadales bacterium]
MTDEIKVNDLTASPEQDAPTKEQASTFRLIATLAIAGALAGLLLVLVNQHTKPLIDAYKAEQLKLAVYEVTPGTEHYDTYYLVDGALSLTLPEGAKEAEYKRIYVGYDADNRLNGVAMSRGESGFQDVILVIFGLNPGTGKLMGMKVLDSKETPGLGDKIYKDMNYVNQFFAGPDTPLIPVKAGAGKGLPGEVDTITVATISSKKLIVIIN